MNIKLNGIVVCMLLIAPVISLGESRTDITPTSITTTCIQLRTQGAWNETQKLVASDGTDMDYFGFVSLDDDTVLIGAVWDNDQQGSAYIFTLTGTIWTQQQKLLANDGDEFFGFGALNGDTALIGAYGNNTGQGAAYVFTRSGTTWTQQQKLVASDGTFGDFFGSRICLEGDTALIGAFGDDNSKGSVYVFTRSGTTWTQQQKLVASDGGEWDYFGISIALEGDTALIGADGDDENKGAAYVFTRSETTWTQQQKLVASDGNAFDHFGVVSLSGDTALIGAYGDDTYKGAVYVFTRSGTTWTQQQKFVASDGAAGDQFGGYFGVALEGDTAIIGAVLDDDNGNSSGSAYVFTRTGTTWTQTQKLLASDGATSDYFGTSIDLDGDTAMIGAIDNDRKGAVYVFIKEGENQPPAIPTIIGPAKGKIKIAIEYNFTTIDPNGDNLYYFIDWGDQTNSSWIGPYPSGDIITQSHTWTKKGTYTIKAKAKDTNGNESGWGQLSVTMPFSFNIPFQSFWERFFEQFPNAFPILRHLIEY